jgi:hypothetical protein
MSAAETNIATIPMPLPHPLVTEEKVRGAIAGSLTGIAATGLNILGVTVLGLSAPVSMALMHYLFGSTMAYILDILIAKYFFHGVHVSYSDIGTRAAWMLYSLTERFFFRFIVTVIIEALTAVAILEALIVMFDRYEYFSEGRAREIRNITLAAVVSAFVYVIFGNVIRYDWAYNENEQPLMNIIVMVWLALTVLVFSRGTNVTDVIAPQKPEPRSSSDAAYTVAAL